MKSKINYFIFIFITLFYITGCSNKNFGVDNNLKNNNKINFKLINNKFYIPFVAYKIKNKYFIIPNKFFIKKYFNYLIKIKPDILNKKILLYICDNKHFYPFYIVNNNKIFYDDLKNKCFIIKKENIFNNIFGDNKTYFIADKFKKIRNLKIFFEINN